MRVRRYRAAAFLTVVMLAIGLLAVVHKGVAAAELKLNDGGVWVTNGRDQLVAHLNYPSRTLDGGLRAGSGEFDVSQAADDIALHDASGKTAAIINPATLELGGPLKMGEWWQAEQGGSVMAVLDASEGRLWAMDVSQIGNFSADAPPIGDDLKAARLAVGIDGAVFTLAQDGSVKRFRLAEGAWAPEDLGPIDGYQSGADVELTTVGDELVVLDRTDGVIRTVDGTTPVGAGAVLQQPGPSRTDAVVATGNALLSVPVDGGQPQERVVGDGSTGTPTRPVVVGDCSYSAWSGTGEYVRDCSGADQDVTQQVSALAQQPALRFRWNRDVVVLNDTGTGDVFLVNQGMQLVNNWQDIQAQVDDERQDDGDSEAEIFTDQPVDRSAENTPPTAVDDRFGVRPGQSTTLPVLANDTDPDGDVLVAVPPETDPSVGALAQVRGGAALQISTPADATGTAQFTYTADDGRGGTAQAVTTVVVRPFDLNDAPGQLRVTTLELEQGSEISYSTLQEWDDPDGDAIYLKSVVGPPGIELRVRPDGLVAIHDLGTAAVGRQELTVVVSDGRADGTGSLVVDVRPKANGAPTANADHIEVLRDRTVVVEPLLNDTDPAGDTLRLTEVAPGDAGTTTVPDFTAGTFSFTSSQVGTQYIDYSITDGPNTAKSIVRVDVIDPDDGDLGRPVADNDVALLPSGGTVTIHPLINDSDAKGGVLVIKSIEGAGELERKGLSVAVLQHELLRITAPRGLPGPTNFTYTVSNGAADATAQVTVVPLPATPTTLPPITAPDSATVRAGDIVTVSVLDNDRSPGGNTLRVDPTLKVDGESLGTVFMSNNKVRLLAGAAPGRMRVVYTAWDSYDNYASSEVVFTVTPNEGQNSPPAPPPLVARVTAGTSVRIPVPLYGVDVDGDSVSLVGVASAPTKGRVEVDGGDLVYVAGDGSAGTDHFTYRVIDPFGLSADGSVDVGIARPARTNQAPVAVADTVIARTGRELAVPVLLNDFDADNDPLSIVPGSVSAVDPSTTTPAVITDDHIDLTTPDQPTTLRFYYGLTDGNGGESQGVLTIRVQLDAPQLAPIAQDDTVSPDEVLDQQSVSVDVLENDSDPDGAFRSLKVSTEVPGVTVGTDGRLSIPVQPARQLVLYTVTDVDNLTSSAVVVVPGSESQPPRLKARPPATVKAGESIDLPLSDYVIVRSGRQPMVTVGVNVTSSGGSTGELVKDDRTLTFSAARDFSGPTSIVVEVTDGSSAEDPDGLKATLSLPIEVLPAGGRPPEFRPSEVTVAAGEPATQVDLRAMVQDADEGDTDRLTFSAGAWPADLTASLDGSTLTVSAPVDAEPGSAYLLDVSVTDGSTDPVTGQIPVRVIASTRPPMEVTDASISDAIAGKPSTIDIAGYVANPFAAEGKPITLVGQPGVSSGRGSVVASGTVLTITPDVGFHGTMVVGYQVADATGVVDRYVTGEVNLTVRDVPDQPTGVDVTTPASRTVSVSWNAPQNNNGAVITDYIVSWNAGAAGSRGAGSSSSQSCGQATSCQITGLTNDVKYTFGVVAVNEVGNSKPSDSSREVRPDVKPDQPQPPTIVPCSPTAPCDGQLQVNWLQPHTDGSAVIGYTLQISGPGVGASQRDGITGTGYTWTGLTNGASYTFSVQAHSSAEEPSDFSASSASDFPAGVPRQAGPPAVSNNYSGNPPPSITVTWQAPDANGDPALTYQVKESTQADGSAADETATSHSFTYSAASTDDKTYVVRAKNKSGWGQWSSASPPTRAFQAPGAVGGLTVTPTGSNNTVSIAFSGAAGNGARPEEISYFWRANGSSGSVANGQRVTSGGAFPNGQNVNVEVYARSTVRGQSVDGPSVSASVNAFGSPSAPAARVGGTAPNNVTLCWETPDSNNGRPVLEVQVQTNDGTTSRPSSGCAQLGSGRNQTWWLQARARTEAGWSDFGNRAQATTWPDKRFEVQEYADCNTPGLAGCKLVRVRLVTWDPNSTGACYAGSTTSALRNWTQTPSAGPDGNSGWVTGGLQDSNGSRFTRGTFPAGTDAGGVTCR